LCTGKRAASDAGCALFAWIFGMQQSRRATRDESLLLIPYGVISGRLEDAAGHQNEVAKDSYPGSV
jgi:hypothetical protein